MNFSYLEPHEQKHIIREKIWGQRWEGGSGLGTHVHLWWIHVNVWKTNAVL